MSEAKRSTFETRLELVATIGPASFDLVGQMLEAGAGSLRINSSHVAPGNLVELLRKIRELSDSRIVVDLQGAKMRLGHFTGRKVQKNEKVELRLELTEEGSGKKDGWLPLPHPEIFASTAAGQTLTVDDGRLSFEVEKSEPEMMRVRALHEGDLLPRKGVNVVEHPVELEDLSDPDIASIEEARGFENICFAFSFMRDGGEARWIRNRLPKARVAAKIERVEATESLDQIVKTVDEIWICRGDLGEQLGPAALARFVGNLEPRALVLPVLMAGQVLEHLSHHSVPTRSEICHLYDLVSRGYTGIVLSDETAIGVDPVGAVRQAREILDAVVD